MTRSESAYQSSPPQEAFTVGAIVAAVREALPGHSSAALHVPTFSGNEWEYVKECIDTGWVSSAGAFVGRFESEVVKYTGARHAVAVVNGTAALHIALLLAGVQPGDEVLMPSLTFVATANAVSYCGATPHLVEVEPGAMGIDAARLADHLERVGERRDGRFFNRETGRPITVLVPMHTFGHPVDLDAAQAVCDRFELVMVEDAAESLGSFYRGKHTGTWGRLGILSFNGNKIVTTGGGGMILTDDPKLAETAKHITTTAKLPHRWEYVHDRVGYNDRLPNINAALGVAQFERLPRLVEAKRALAERYFRAFEGKQEVALLREPAYARSNYWLNTLVLDESLADQRDAVLGALSDAGFQVRPVWRPMHQLPMYRDCPRMDLPVTESLARRVINLPSSAHL